MLTDQELRFVEAFVATHDGDGALREAGYEPTRQLMFELTERAEIQTAIESRLAAQWEEREAERDPDQQLRRLLASPIRPGQVEAVTDLLLERDDPRGHFLSWFFQDPQWRCTGLGRDEQGTYACFLFEPFVEVLGEPEPRAEFIMLPPLDHCGVYAVHGFLGVLEPVLVSRSTTVDLVHTAWELPSWSVARHAASWGLSDVGSTDLEAVTDHYRFPPLSYLQPKRRSLMAHRGPRQPSLLDRLRSADAGVVVTALEGLVSRAERLVQPLGPSAAELEAVAAQLRPSTPMDPCPYTGRAFDPRTYLAGQILVARGQRQQVIERYRAGGEPAWRASLCLALTEDTDDRWVADLLQLTQQVRLREWFRWLPETLIQRLATLEPLGRELLGALPFSRYSAKPTRVALDTLDNPPGWFDAELRTSMTDRMWLFGSDPRVNGHTTRDRLTRLGHP